MTALLAEGGGGDIDAVMQVMTAAFDPAFGEAWSRGQCLGILSLPDVWLSLAHRDQALIGFALCRRAADEAELLLLAVTPAARRAGAGAALVERTARLAAERGARRLLLEVREANAAVALYRRTGFVEVGRRRDYYHGPGGARYDALTLARPLG